MVPLDSLEVLLKLTPAQKSTVELLKKTMEALRSENFAAPALAQLKLTEDQVKRIASGERLSRVLSADQRRVFESNKRQFGGPGGPGGQGFPGGQGGQGFPGGGRPGGPGGQGFPGGPSGPQPGGGGGVGGPPPSFEL